MWGCFSLHNNSITPLTNHVLRLSAAEYLQLIFWMLAKYLIYDFTFTFSFFFFICSELNWNLEYLHAKKMVDKVEISI